MTRRQEERKSSSVMMSLSPSWASSIENALLLANMCNEEY